MTRKTPRELAQVQALICERTGLAVSHLRSQDRARLLNQAMEQAGFSDENHFVAFLRNAGSELLTLAAKMSVGETYFFRDPEQLAFMAEQVLPRLLLERPRDHVLRIWSAGCASGEEAYTLAMMLAERSWLDRAQIVGSDISEPALARASAGRYAAWSLRATPRLAKQRFFTAMKQEFQLDPELMRHVRFERQSLTDLDAKLPGGDQPFDLVLCRNVLIYFTPDAQAAASARIARSLAPGGTLIAGASDHFSELPALWRRSVLTSGVSYTRLAAPVPPAAAAGEPARGRHKSVGPSESKTASAARRTPRHGIHAALARPKARFDKIRPSVGPAATAQAHRSGSGSGSGSEPQRAGEARPGLARVREVGKREGSASAVEACQAALRDEPLSLELNLCLVSLLLELDRDDAADAALRRLLYVERNCVMGHLFSALLLRRAQQHLRAARAYRRVATLCAAQPEDSLVPLGEGVTHGALQDVAATEARALEKLAQAS